MRNSFFDFAKEIFGIEFKKWYESGFWKDDYVCYSLVDNGRIISNVSFSRLDMMIEGKMFKAVQIGTVGTLSPYRGKGLSKHLMEKVIGDNKDGADFFFLSANRSVINFYQRFGFRRVYEYEFIANIRPGKNNGNSRRLDIDIDDDMKILTGLCDRMPVSGIFNASDYRFILLWYATGIFKECFYYIEKEDVIVVCEMNGGMLDVYDIISHGTCDVHRLFSYLPFESVERIRFHFTPDLIGIKTQSRPIINDDDPFFIYGNFPLEGKPFALPALART